jgi:hypothetical protein
MTLFARTGTLKSIRRVCVVVFSILGFVLLFGSARAQSPNAFNDIASRINRERIGRGLIPYSLNAKLNAAAQAHAKDIARTGKYSHIGSDGSTVFDRVARAGYGAYSWGRRLGENWAWYHDPQTALQMWMGSTPHRNNILHAVYREFGIGVAAAPSGGFVYVVDFGVQPNVLPVFIQNGAGETGSRQIVLTLSNENYAASGDGANTIGKATQVQISSSASFAGAQWQPFSSKFAWTLPPGDGTKTLYVKYRDARGRMATSSDSISADLPPAQDSSPTPKPSPKASPTNTKPKPTATRTAAALPSITTLPDLSVTTRVTSVPSVTPETTDAPTETPAPTITPIPEATETPNLASVAMSAAQTPEGMIDLQEEIPPAQNQPASAFDSSEGSTPSQVIPIVLGIFGMSLTLGVLAFVKWLEHRGKNDQIQK